jgi:hypothetical protein
VKTDSADILLPGDQFDIPMGDGTFRRVEVTDTGDAGFTVKWFLPDGRGPFFAVLPHGSFPSRPLVRQEDARGGLHKHFMDFHEDFTGKYGWL